jgi:hypothetical protein
LVSLTAPERARYEALFAAADGDKDGVIGPADAAWFLSLGLDKTTLSEVTSLPPPPPTTTLDQSGSTTRLSPSSLAVVCSLSVCAVLGRLGVAAVGWRETRFPVEGGVLPRAAPRSSRPPLPASLHPGRLSPHRAPYAAPAAPLCSLSSKAFARSLLFCNPTNFAVAIVV